MPLRKERLIKLAVSVPPLFLFLYPKATLSSPISGVSKGRKEPKEERGAPLSLSLSPSHIDPDPRSKKTAKTKGCEPLGLSLSETEEGKGRKEGRRGGRIVDHPSRFQGSSTLVYQNMTNLEITFTALPLKNG